MQIAFGARSDTGRARENNEDSFALAPELNLFVLSDGMGGLAAGEVASKLASETVSRSLSRSGSKSVAPVDRRTPGWNVCAFQQIGQRDTRRKPRGVRGRARSVKRNAAWAQQLWLCGSWTKCA